jgi:hypothetical protein
VEQKPKEPSPQQKLAYALAEWEKYRTLAARPGKSPQAAAAAHNLARSYRAAADLYERGLSGEREPVVSALNLALPQDLAGAFAGPPTKSPGQQLKPRQRQEQQPKQSVEEKLESTLDPGREPLSAKPTSEPPPPNPGTLLFSNRNMHRWTERPWRERKEDQPAGNLELAGKDDFFEQNEPPKLLGSAELDQRSSLPLGRKPGSGRAAGRVRPGKETLRGLGVAVASQGFIAVCLLYFDQIAYYGTLAEMGFLVLFVAWRGFVLLLAVGRLGARGRR